MRTAPPDYAAARFKGERAKVQEAYLKRAGEQDIQKLEKGLGKEEMSKVITQMAAIAPGLEKRIGNAVKDVDLKTAAFKKVDVTSPEFTRAREEYFNELSPSELGEAFTAENIKNNAAVQDYMLKHAGEREMGPITRTGEQIRALAEVIQNYADKQVNANSPVGQKILTERTLYVAAGNSEEEANKAAIFNNMTQVVRETQQEKKIKNENLINWLGATPGRSVMFAEGRRLNRAESYEEDDFREWKKFKKQRRQQKRGGTIDRDDATSQGQSTPPPTGGTTGGGGGGTTP